MAWPIARLPTFFVRALGLQQDQVPDTLEEILVPTVAVGAWAYAELRYGVLAQTGGGSSANTIVACTADQQALLLGVSLSRAGGATASATSWFLQVGQDTTQRVTLRQLALANNLSHVDYFGAVDAYVYVPPSFTLIFSIPALAGGETVTLRRLVAVFPAGFKVR